MNEQEQLRIFANDLLQEVIVNSDDGETGKFRINEFTRLASEYLIEAGEIDDITVCYYKSRGMKINGYSVRQHEDCLDLFVTVFNQQTSPVSVTRTQTETAFRQSENVLRKALTGYHRVLEESSEIYDMFQLIYELGKKLTNVRIYLLTDGIVNVENVTTRSMDGISIIFHIWDIRRIYRFVSSGKKFEPIEIDFKQEFGTTISCLPMADIDSDYQGYLAVIPGNILAEMYDKYGPRLLERNVRSFLQVRGNVNKGIRKTIMEEPHRFFAYNNGVSATAEKIEFDEYSNAQKQIRKVQNLQIVNGGQTTATLYHAMKKDKAHLKGIYVQAKLSVIPPEQIDRIVPLISRYANNQNKVSEADFYANDPFHIHIEELSRTIWAPPVSGTNKQTKWFYERARGQYLDAKNREGTSARKRQFETIYPNMQKFTKTDLAKFENTWMQLPYLVSLGAQKNFIYFSIGLKERGNIDINGDYFKGLIAKAILFKHTEKLIKEINYGGYRANIVTYTLAWLSCYASQYIDLDMIWKKQNIPLTLQEAIREVSVSVHRVITSPPDGRNITEWCKNKECWRVLCGEEIHVILQQESSLAHNTAEKSDIIMDNFTSKNLNLIDYISKISAQNWFDLWKWAKETNNLQGWQRSFLFSLSKAISSGYKISEEQANRAAKILEEVKILGFNHRIN